MNVAGWHGGGLAGLKVGRLEGSNVGALERWAFSSIVPRLSSIVGRPSSVLPLPLAPLLPRTPAPPPLRSQLQPQILAQFVQRLVDGRLEHVGGSGGPGPADAEEPHHAKDAATVEMEQVRDVGRGEGTVVDDLLEVGGKAQVAPIQLGDGVVDGHAGREGVWPVDLGLGEEAVPQVELTAGRWATLF